MKRVWDPPYVRRKYALRGLLQAKCCPPRARVLAFDGRGLTLFDLAGLCCSGDGGAAGAGKPDCAGHWRAVASRAARRSGGCRLGLADRVPRHDCRVGGWLDSTPAAGRGAAVVIGVARGCLVGCGLGSGACGVGAQGAAYPGLGRGRGVVRWWGGPVLMAGVMMDRAFSHRYGCAVVVSTRWRRTCPSGQSEAAL